MRFHIVKPFIFQAVYALFLFIVVPLVLVLGPWIKIEIADNIGIVFILVGSILYLNVILFEIVPGVCSLFDLLVNSFQTEKMVFLQGYADRRRLFATKGEKKRGKQSLYEYAFFDFQFSTSKGKKLLYTTFMASLTPGESYTVQYGKFSKTIVSIVDNKDEELLLAN